jgi:AraC-like DNA-binding protein
LSVGFQAQAHFSTVFKRLTGHTPAQWRRANVDPTASVSRPAPIIREMPDALVD